ncbi:MAG: hypothetical protein KC646_14615 [Candidatus Cloacimonetes bacterium]|nr:hypothetical protein [Candidatus Cloacimonadota bacterium]
MLALITICILCFSIDTNLIQELSTPHLNTIWIPILAWIIAVFLFAFLAKHTKYLVYLLQIVYLALFCPLVSTNLETLNANFSLQTLLIFTLAIFLAFIESFPPKFVLQKANLKNSFNTSPLTINLSLILKSIQTYILLALFLIFYLISTFHPLFNGSDSLLDNALVFIVSVPLIYSTRRLE